ncbi:MAG TPA: DinB family protein [Longimicrobium sp.]|nr:DinB family protein [Longimicrobium sp.]
MDAQPTLFLLDFSQRTLGLNLDGLTHDESLAAPAGGNNANWVLGHILVHRDKMLALLGQEKLFDSEAAAVYDRGSEPLADGARARALDDLRADLARSYDLLKEALGRATPEQLAASAGTRPVAEMLLFLAGHELYHGGQIGLLRRGAGHAGAIR